MNPCLLLCVLLAALPVLKAAALEICIVPRPLKIEPHDGSFKLTAETAIVAGTGAATEADQLRDALRAATGFELRKAEAAAANSITLALDPSLEPSVGPEGYVLNVRPDRISIRAAEPAGLFYGGITLRQLLPSDILAQPPNAAQHQTDWRVPCLEIQDRPRFVWRGLLIDVGRHYMPIEFLKKVVDLLTLHKLNTRFVQDILTEVTGLFPSRFVHIGGDQAPRDR
jgi:hexosaminidase